jgi:hypothetical protein
MNSIIKKLMAILVLLSVTVSMAQDKNQGTELQPVFDNYFQLKDALVKSSGKTAATESAELLAAIKAVKMESLSASEHTIWMKIQNDLKEDAEHISETNDVGHQRDHFVTLSQNIYELQKVSKTDNPVYYQFCPMANNRKGANWLSRESAIKNPYYGTQMLTCGKTVETIK